MEAYECSFGGVLNEDKTDYLVTINWDNEEVTKRSCTTKAANLSFLYKMYSNTKVSNIDRLVIKDKKDNYAFFCPVCAMHLYVVYEFEFADDGKERIEKQFGELPPPNALGLPIGSDLTDLIS
jgi:hypothetical protein